MITDDTLLGASRFDAQTLRECHGRGDVPSWHKADEEASKRCISVFLYSLFLASHRVVKNRSALVWPTKSTVICNYGNTSGTWGWGLDKEIKKKSSKPQKHRWSCLHCGFQLRLIKSCVDLENYRWAAKFHGFTA